MAPKVLLATMLKCTYPGYRSERNTTILFPASCFNDHDPCVPCIHVPHVAQLASVAPCRVHARVHF